MCEGHLDPFFRTQINVHKGIQFAVNCNELFEAFGSVAFRLIHVVSDEGTFGVVPFFPIDKTATVKCLNEGQSSDKQLTTLVLCCFAFIPEGPVLDTQITQSREFGQSIDVVPCIDFCAT